MFIFWKQFISLSGATTKHLNVCHSSLPGQYDGVLLKKKKKYQKSTKNVEKKDEQK